jgi:zinc protease
MIGYKGPAYNDATKETAALEALQYLAFSSNSDLYQRLVVKEQKADAIFGGSPTELDPGLFEIIARVKRVEDMNYVRDQILATVEQFRKTPVEPAKLDQVRKRLRYESALRMDNSDAIASILAQYVALKRTPETMNALFDQYSKLTPEDIRQAASKYLVESGRTIATLTGPGGSK